MSTRYGFRAIRQETQGGPAKARNFGAKVATGEWLLFLDADVEASPNLISIAQKAIAQHPDTGAFIGSYDDRPGDPGFLSQYRNLLHHFVHQEAGPEASTFWGACGLIRKSAFEKVGGFDAETYAIPCIEDIELGYRLKKVGLKIRHQNDLLIKHWKRWTVVNMLRTDIFQRAVPWTKLILQTNESHYELNLGLKYRIGLVCSCLILFTPILLIFSPLLALILSLTCAVFYLWIHFKLLCFLKNEKGMYFSVKLKAHFGAGSMISVVGLVLSLDMQAIGFQTPTNVHHKVRKMRLNRHKLSPLEQHQIFLRTFGRIDPIALGTALALTFSFAFTAATTIAILQDASDLKQQLDLLGNYFPRFRTTPLRSLLAIPYGAITGFFLCHCS